MVLRGQLRETGGGEERDLAGGVFDAEWASVREGHHRTFWGGGQPKPKRWE